MIINRLFGNWNFDSNVENCCVSDYEQQQKKLKKNIIKTETKAEKERKIETETKAEKERKIETETKKIINNSFTTNYQEKLTNYQEKFMNTKIRKVNNRYKKM